MIAMETYNAECIGLDATTAVVQSCPDITKQKISLLTAEAAAGSPSLSLLFSPSPISS